MDEKRRNIFARLMDEAGLPPEEALEMVQNASESAMDALVGVGEVGLSVASGLAGVVAGLPGSTGEVLAGRGTEEQREKYPGLAPTPEDTLFPTVGEMAEKWTYQPKTETGQQYAENVGKVMAPVDKFLKDFSGFIPGIVEKVPGDSRLGSGILNAADQAIYTALNVMSPTRGAGTAAMLGAKGLQAGAKAASHLPGAKGLRNVDLVGKTAEIVEKAPVIKRFNQINNAMGNLITRKQLAGMQPGVMQGTKKTVRPWYKGGKHQQLGVMAKTTAWNIKQKMTDNQDAWLRAHYGITANVYKEMDRLGQVMDSAKKQSEIKTPDRFDGRLSDRKFLDEDGNMILKEDSYFATKKNKKTNKKEPISPEQKAHLMAGRGDAKHYKSVKDILNDASNQYHAQVAYNVSVLEKFKPGDPRIARLQEGGLDRYIFPQHKQTTVEGLKQNPKIIQDLVGKNLDKELIKKHISPKIVSDMGLKGTKVHISTKPFFTGNIAHQIGSFSPAPTGLAKGIQGLLGRTIVFDGRAIKLTNTKHANYINKLRSVVNDFADANKKRADRGLPPQELTKDAVIQSFKDYNVKYKNLPKKQLFDIQYLKKNIVDDGEFISISQQILTNDTLLATMPVRFIVNKRNPSKGYFIMYDQMKQGSGMPLVESGLDVGSDINRIFIDVQMADADYVWKAGAVPKVKDVIEPGIVAKDLGQRVRQKFDVPPTEEFLRKRRFGRKYTPPLVWTSKRGSTAGLLAQDENI